jgi:hypothetical protein
MDGSGRTTALGDVNLITAHQTTTTQLFAVNGNVYLAGSLLGDSGIPTDDWGIFAVPTSGGAANMVLGAGGKWTGAQIYRVDTSGIYFTYAAGAGVGGNATAPLGGGTLTPLGSVGESETVAVNGGFLWSADLQLTQLSSSLLKAPLAGGAAATVQTYQDEEGATIDGDAAGLYWWATGGNGGLYSIDPSTGNQTLVTDGNGSLSNQNHAMDAKNVYFVEDTGGVYSVWSHAR